MLSSRFQLSMRSRDDWRGGRLKRIFLAAKYLIRSASVWQAHSQWLDFIATTPSMPAVIAHDRRLLERYQHRYISLRFDRARRLAIVQSHYRFIAKQWPAGLLHDVYVERSAIIGTLPLRDGSTVNIMLQAPPIKGLEGELGIHLCNSAGITLSCMVVTIADDGSTLLIGCVQGAKATVGKEAVRELTRQCHGLRPKNLLLSLAYGVAASYGIERIRGVGQGVHPLAGRNNKIKSDYNGFWLEAGGTLAADGLFDLPAREAVRDAATIDSKHRSAFRRREAMRADAIAMLRRALGEVALPQRQQAA